MKILTTQVSICFFFKVYLNFFFQVKTACSGENKIYLCQHENCSCRQHVDPNTCETTDNNQEPSQRINNEFLMDVTGL